MLIRFDECIDTSLEQCHMLLTPESCSSIYIYTYNGICAFLLDLEVTLDLSGSVKY